MKIFYQDPSVVIIHGDCREIVPTLTPRQFWPEAGEKFDLLLTDPPYGINGSSGTINKSRAKGEYAGFDDTPESIKTIIVPVFLSVMENVRTAIITPGSRCCQMYPQPDSVGCFFQPASVGVQRFGNVDANLIFYYGKCPHPNLGRPCSFQLTESPPKNGHPCPKPIDGWRKLLISGSVEGETVLDIFAGSCTTARAAKDLGRRCVCIEREEKYCEIAARRMAQEVLAL